MIELSASRALNFATQQQNGPVPSLMRVGRNAYQSNRMASGRDYLISWF